jgi:hypothetical protein
MKSFCSKIMTFILSVFIFTDGALYYGTNLLAEDDNSSLSDNFYISVYLNTGCLYALRVSGTSEGEEGNYILYISQ